MHLQVNLHIATIKIQTVADSKQKKEAIGPKCVTENIYKITVGKHVDFVSNVLTFINKINEGCLFQRDL